MELNQKLTKAHHEDARYGVFTRRKNTYVRTWGLKRGEGVCSKGAHFRELMVHGYAIRMHYLSAMLLLEFTDVDTAQEVHY